ncbi:MAG: diguanylate cyclase [Pseudomonadota bacterium]
MAESSTDLLVRRRCVDFAYTHGTGADINSFFCGAVVLAVYGADVPAAMLTSWLAALLVWIFVGQAVAARHDPEAEKPRGLATLYVLLGCGGLLWGGLLGWLALSIGIEALGVLGLIAAMLLTSNLSSYAAVLPVFVVYATLVLAPLGVGFLLHDGELAWLGAALLPAWLAFLYLAGRRFQSFYRSAARQEVENAELVENLDVTNSTVVELNVVLQEKIDALNEASTELVKEKEHVESLVEELRQMSHTDALTGLNNRRCFDEVLEREWSRAVRQSEEMALLLADIDFFKQFNDLYGHQKGDECLVRVAQVVKDIGRRATDCPARYGGEEFAIILPNTDAYAALALAERGRKALEALALPHSGGIGAAGGVGYGIVTMSYGVASLPATADTSAEELIGLADAALYEAKKAGRNRVMRHSAAERAKYG